MCARYEHQQTDLSTIGDLVEELVQVDAPGWEPPADIRPTDLAPVLLRSPSAAPGGGEEALKVELLEWGLIPSWSATSGRRPINARIETADTQRMFRNAFRERRCLIPATCFIEWQKLAKGGRALHRVFAADGSLLAFAGLWERWNGPAGVVRTFTILTGPPSPVVSALHHRQPVILTPELREAWLAPGPLEPAVHRALLDPFEALAIEGGGVRQLGLFD